MRAGFSLCNGYGILALLLASALVANAAPQGQVNKGNQDEEELSNKLLPFIPLKGATFYSTIDESTRSDKSSSNVIPGYSFELERESSNPEAKEEKPQGSKKVEDSVEAKNLEKIKNIAYNSREVLLVGPEQKEVEIKDNVAAKMAVAFENFKQEATEVWGVVNEKLDQGWSEINKELGKGWTELNKELDKGWTGFKSMVEGAVSKQNGEKKSSQ